MSKTDHNPHAAAARSARELPADALDQIAGGTPSIPIPPPAGYTIGRIEPRFPRLA